MDNFERWWRSLPSYRGAEKEIARKAFGAGQDSVSCDCNHTSAFPMTCLSLVLVFFWIVGIVIAKGVAQTICAIFPLYAWYLVVEHFMKMFNLV